MWYKIFMLVMVPILGIAWLAYYLYMRKELEEEKKQPKKESERLTKTKSEVADWAQKMAAFESPREKRKRELEEQKKKQSQGDSTD